MSTSSTVLSAFRRSTVNSLRLQAPISKRFFTPSAANMVVKTYFDVNWTGPEVTVDQRGNVTNVGPVKGELPRHAMLPSSAPVGAACSCSPAQRAWCMNHC
jgi:peptidylprolyl isomerase